MKLWQKGNEEENEQAKAIEKFTVGKDREWDMRLARYDVIGSKAHAEMLYETGIITRQDNDAIQQGLNEILLLIEAGAFVIEESVEDVHSQIEKILTDKAGDAGKKLHTGRSRNDQVLVDLKLLLKHELTLVTTKVITLFDRYIELAEQHQQKLLPGYTHFQLAMPSSFGLWFSAYAESLIDDVEALHYAYRVADKNPLGSGAGYGSAFPLNRKLTTTLLGFSDLNYNSVYAQMTRGKTEKATLVALASVAATISKFSYDVCLYMNQQFAYISFPASLTTGSSIMPHKKNPDVFELLRAKCNRLQSYPNEMTLLINNLPSGYHRDMQLTKDILFPALESIHECLDMLIYSLQHIEVRVNLLEDDKFNDLFTVEEINKLVVKGIPFRDAYKTIGNSVNDGTYKPEKQLHHTHEGSINNLCLNDIKAAMKKASLFIS